jgi:L-asparaginase / beta-aspartyl-peptidase
MAVTAPGWFQTARQSRSLWRFSKRRRLEGGPSLALHGRAGGRAGQLAVAARAPHEQGLLAAYRAGWQVLAAGGGALDAVCASVEMLENDPLFNAGRGAALTASGAR